MSSVHSPLPKDNGITVGKVVIEENVSGAAPVAQRKLEKLIR
jgi:hypothetical protein